MMMSKRKKCKYCKENFNPTYSTTQQVCSYKCAIELNKTKSKKEWSKKKKAGLEKLKTKGDYFKEVQIVFNKWVRLRDRGEVCISCQKPNGAEQAGHYRSVGSSPELRFNEFNVNGQCVRCNMHLHGNLINYRIGLIKKYGIKKVEKLEKYHKMNNYTIFELKDLKEKYKSKIRALSK